MIGSMLTARQTVSTVQNWNPEGLGAIANNLRFPGQYLSESVRS
jgi:hypothetical protein